MLRDGKNQNIDVTLGEQQNAKTKAESLHQGLSGAELSNTTDSDPIQGVKVTEVQKGSAAESYQLQKTTLSLALTVSG